MVAKIWTKPLSFLMILTLLLGVAGAGMVTAEQVVTAKITALSTVQYDQGIADQASAGGGEDPAPGWLAFPSAQAELGFASTGNRNVKAEIRLSATLGTVSLVDISRLWVKFRVPKLTITLGKTRLAWGQGLFFNAADLLHGSIGLTADLSAEELRSQADWVSALTYSLGPFSLLEVATVLPAPNTLAALAGQLVPQNPQTPDPQATDNQATSILPSLSQGKVAARFKLPLGPVDTEVAYRFTWPSHTLGLSVQWHLLVNWLASATLAIPGPGASQTDRENPADAVSRDLRITAGIYDILKLGAETSLSFRIEGLIAPGSEEDQRLYLYPDVTVSLNPTMAVSLRGLINPITPWMKWNTSFSWQIFQGTTLITNLGGNAGESIWGVMEPGLPQADLSLSIGLRYVY